MDDLSRNLQQTPWLFWAFVIGSVYLILGLLWIGGHYMGLKKNRKSWYDEVDEYNAAVAHGENPDVPKPEKKTPPGTVVSVLIGAVLAFSIIMDTSGALFCEYLIDITLTFAIYSLPIVIYRYTIEKKPVPSKKAKKITILYGILAFCIMFGLKVLLVIAGLSDGSLNAGAFFFWCWFNYRILSDIPEEAAEKMIQALPVPEPLPAPAKPTIADQIAAEEARYRELEAEIRKIPAKKVKEWHAEGKLTDEQFLQIAKKYNKLRTEMRDIRERIEVLKQIENTPEP
jgi:hypothetical protein